MTLSDSIWDKLGELQEEEALHVLTKLFVTYETQHRGDSNDIESQKFFKNLQNAIEQTTQCNLNRR